MKINRKQELEEIELQLMSLKENERMARFKIEGIKELEINKQSRIRTRVKTKIKELIFKKLGLNCEVSNTL